MPFIKVISLSKSYGEIKAVDDVSFDIERKDIFGLLGPNGAGKSTLISMLTTLLIPDSGEIFINDFSVRKQPAEVKKLIGLVPQEVALYPTLSAKENLDFWGSMYGLKGQLLKNRIEEAIEITGLKERLNDRIETYSGGMKRRVNIAAALLHRPDILIMDEPTVGIDPQSRNHILETVLKLNNEGMTIVYTSHYMEEVEFLCNKIAIMDHGKIIAVGSSDELKKMNGNEDIINIELSGFAINLIDDIKCVDGVKDVIADEKKIQIILDDAEVLLAKIISIIDSHKCKIQSVNIEETNLETLFLQLTGRALRD